jgi:hypothetical protein
LFGRLNLTLPSNLENDVDILRHHLAP